MSHKIDSCVDKDFCLITTKSLKVSLFFFSPPFTLLSFYLPLGMSSRNENREVKAFGLELRYKGFFLSFKNVFCAIRKGSSSSIGDSFRGWYLPTDPSSCALLLFEKAQVSSRNYKGLRRRCVRRRTRVK